MATQPWRTRENGPETLPALPARLTYSLLKAAVKVAAWANMPMGELLDLTQLAYFEELRSGHPRELSFIAERLGLSLRTVSTLNRRIKEAFFAAESQVQPARRVASLLTDGPKSLAELKRAAPELGGKALKQALELMRRNGWAKLEDRRYELSARLRSYIDDSLTWRIDGLNNQMEILAASVWRRFIEGDDTAIGRSWVFAANPNKIPAFLEETIRALRHGAIDLEESALRDSDFQRYGITLAFAGVEDKP